MVIWTPLAQKDLKAIYDYIAKDSLFNAKKVSKEIVQKVETSLSSPLDLMGKKIPEFERDDLREIHIHSWRVIYQLQNHNKFVLTLFHKRRELLASDLAVKQ